MRAWVARSNQRYLDALIEIQAGHFDRAEGLLKGVKYGNYVEQAKSELKGLPVLREKAQAAEFVNFQRATTSVIKERHAFWMSAFLDAQVEATKNLESEDFTLINGEKIEDRVAHLEHMSKRGSLSKGCKENSAEVRVLSSEVALVKGACSLASPSGVNFRFTQVWKRAAETWLLIHMQQSNAL
jgi:hypothetical protein